VVSFALLLTHFLLIIYAERSLQSQALVIRFFSFAISSTVTAAGPMVRVLAFALCGDDLTWRQAWSIYLFGLVALLIATLSTGMALSESICGSFGYGVWCIGLCWVY